MFVINQEIAVLTLILLGAIIFKSRNKFQDYQQEVITYQQEGMTNQQNLIKSSCPNIKPEVLEKNDISSDAILIACKGDWIKYNLADDHLSNNFSKEKSTYFYNTTTSTKYLLDVVLDSDNNVVSSKCHVLKNNNWMQCDPDLVLSSGFKWNKYLLSYDICGTEKPLLCDNKSEKCVRNLDNCKSKSIFNISRNKDSETNSKSDKVQETKPTEDPEIGTIKRIIDYIKGNMEDIIISAVAGVIAIISLTLITVYMLEKMFTKVKEKVKAKKSAKKSEKSVANLSENTSAKTSTKSVANLSANTSTKPVTSLSTNINTNTNK